ncbi:hypothetical protein SALBM311S_01326 [Streptomyces alboniger]
MRNSAIATAIGTAITMAMIEETTVPNARTAMPNFAGSRLVFHSKAVKKLASSLPIAIEARYVRKTAIAAMITSSRMPEPRERPRKTSSPTRPVGWGRSLRVQGAPAGPAVVSVGAGGAVVFRCSVVGDVRRAPLVGGAPDGWGRDWDLARVVPGTAGGGSWRRCAAAGLPAVRGARGVRPVLPDGCRALRAATRGRRSWLADLGVDVGRGSGA